MNSLKTLTLPRLGEADLAQVQGGLQPLWLALAALPLAASVTWHYRNAHGTVSGSLRGTSPGLSGSPAGWKHAFSLGGSLVIHRPDFDLNLSGSLQAGPGAPRLAPAKVGG